MIWLAGLLLALPATAQTLRLAVINTGLSRDGPGLLLRDIRARAPDVLALRDRIVAARPDALLLANVDHDLDGRALAALAALLADAGHPMPHSFAPRPNSGLATGLDLDGDGRRGRADDAQGYGQFAGHGGLALLSRLPIDHDRARDFTGFLWRDLPGALIPHVDGQPFPSGSAHAIQRLSSTGHWDVPLILPGGGRLHLLAWHAGPPAFGGPQQRNRRRNHDETRFWSLLLDNALPMPPPPDPFVVIGISNLDPEAGDGMHEAMRDLLAHPALQDPAPAGQPPDPAAPATVTAYWPGGAGALRVGYVLPARGLSVVGAGLDWPDLPADARQQALIRVDLAMP